MKSPKVKYTIPYKYNGQIWGRRNASRATGRSSPAGGFGGKGGKLLVPTTSNICPFAVRK